MSENLQGWVDALEDILGSIAEYTMAEIMIAIKDLLFNLWQTDEIEDDDYLELCREATYIQLDEDLSMLVV